MPNPKRVHRPAIQPPTTNPVALQKSVEQLKEAVEILQGQRGIDNMDTAVRFIDLVNLGLIKKGDVPPWGDTT